MLKTTFGEPRMVENDLRIRAARHEFESHERVHSGRPIAGSPSLNNALVGNELDVAPTDQASEERKRATGAALNLCRCTREGSELLGIQKRFVDAPGTHIEIDLLMQG